MEENYIILATDIIKGQESIVGPLAWTEAAKVDGLNVSNHNIEIRSGGKKILEMLVKQYEALFGQASIEACKDSVRPLLPKMKGIDLPSILL